MSISSVLRGWLKISKHMLILTITHRGVLIKKGIARHSSERRTNYKNCCRDRPRSMALHFLSFERAAPGSSATSGSSIPPISGSARSKSETDKPRRP